MLIALIEKIDFFLIFDIIINNGSRADGEVSSQLEAESYTNLLTSETKKLDYFKNNQVFLGCGLSILLYTISFYHTSSS
mgnify:CR=1 FL=1